MEVEFAEIIGFITLIVAVLAYQMSNPKIALYLLFFASVGWSTHFFLLGEIAFIVTSINALRNLCASKLNTLHMKYVVIFCFLASSLFTLFQVTDAKDFIPVLGVLFTSVAALRRDSKFAFRLFYLFGETTWLVYGLLIVSLPLSIASSFFIVSIIISIMRHDIKFSNLKLTLTPVMSD